MTSYQVEITVHGATPPRGKPVIQLTYIIKAENPTNAGLQALNFAKCTQTRHPHKFKNATFTVSPDSIKEFKF